MRPRIIRAMESHAAAPFAELARSYCAWAERRTERLPGESERDVHKREALVLRMHFSALYASGLALCDEDFEAGFEEAEHEPPNCEHEVVRATGRLQDLPFSYYWYSCGPLDISGDGSFALGDLCDDLLDVWQDLQGGLALWDAGHWRDAGWAWQFGFKSHWGEHIAGSLGVLHGWLRSVACD